MSEAILKIPSMIETIHVEQSPSMIDDRPTMLSNRPSMLLDSLSINSLSMVGDKHAFADRPSMINNNNNNNNNNNRENEDGDLSNPDDMDTDQYKTANASKRGKRKKYQKYTPEDRFAIGKYCFEHGPAAARKTFQDRYPEMSESVTRGFRDKYKLIIGESAVYEFEQERLKENQQRSGPLPRGRPRKYKPVVEEEISASMVSRNPSPPTVNGDTDVKSYSTDQKVRPEQHYDESYSADRKVRSEQHYDHYYKEEKDEGATERRMNKDRRIYSSETSTKQSEYTISDKLNIGKMCAQEGLNITVKKLRHEYLGLNEEMVINFHKTYLESGVVTNTEPQVFILDSVDHTSTTKPLISMSDNRPVYKQANEKMDYKHSINERTTSNPQHRQSYLRGLLESAYRETRSPPPRSPSNRSPSYQTSPRDTTRPVASVEASSVASPQVSPPIIHYPKLPSEPSSRKFVDEPRRVKREYSSAMETTKREYNSTMETNGYHDTEGGGYPYDKQPYEQQSPPNVNNNNDNSNPRVKRFKYQKYTPEDRYNIGKLCNEIGLGATVKVYREQFPRLNESVVRTFRNKYRELIQKGNGTPAAEAIERKPSRRSISSLIENDVASQLRQFKLSKIELSENLVIAVAENIITSKDPRETVGMRSLLTKEWANSLLWKHKLVDKLLTNVNRVCCERCQTTLICPKCN